MLKQAHKHFDSMESAINHIETTNRLPNSGHSSEKSNVKHYGPMLSDCFKLMRNGWPEGRSFMSNLLSVGRNATHMGAVKGQSLDVGGAYPFIPAAVAGDPENMWSINADANKTKPIVRIYTPGIFSGGMSHDRINNLGGACLTIVDQLEGAGFQTEIVSYYASNDCMEAYAATVQVKSAGEPLDLDRAAFALCHPSMCRRVFFAITERWHASVKSTASGGYGYIVDMDKELIEPNSIYIPSPASAEFGTNNAALATLEGAAEWIKAKVKKSAFADMIEFE